MNNEVIGGILIPFVGTTLGAAGVFFMKKELDPLVDTAWKQDGVIGSRMTGAGFGGCTVSIVKTDCVDKFIENVGKAYLEKIGYAADFYVVEIGDGGRVLA